MLPVSEPASTVHCDCAVQGENGWDLLRAVQEVKQLAQKAMEEESLLAAEAVEQRIKDVSLADSISQLFCLAGM